MRTIIYGQARSGTTALYLLLQAQLPTATLCFLEPSLPYAPAVCLAPDVLVKSLVASLPGTHEVVPDPAWFQRRYVLVRDPRDRLLSALLFLLHWAPPAGQGQDEQASRCQEVTRLLRRNERHPGRLSVQALFAAVMAIRFGLTGSDAGEALWALQCRFLTWEAQLPAHTLVRYEWLITAFPHPTPRPYAWIRRSASMGEWRHWFTPEDCAYFQPLLRPYLRRFGYPDDWTLAAAPTIASAGSSQYVERWQRVARLRQRRAHAVSP
jgi:hypothetical protein